MHEEDFCCSICLDIFVEPHIIQCGHSFCRLCIDDQIGLFDCCPICRRKNPGHPISNRQLESCTMRWMEDHGRGRDYTQMRDDNRKKLARKTRALVIIYTFLENKTNRTGSIDELLQNEDVTEDSLREEVARQINLQQLVGTLRVYKHDSGATLIRMELDDDPQQSATSS